MSSLVLMMGGVAIVFLPFIYAARVMDRYNRQIICGKIIEMAGLSSILK